MADIKTTIILLCKHLNFLFDLDLKPEMFRIAKYNKLDKDAVQVFWLLLQKMTDCYSIHEVKEHFLKNLKYASIHFYGLVDDTPSGTRELLFALAHAMASNYLNKIIKTKILKTPLNPQYNLVHQETIYPKTNYSFNFKHFKDETDYTNAIEWIEGRTQLYKRQLLEYKEQIWNLGSKIAKLKLSPHMTISQIMALHNGKLAKEYMEQTEVILKILQNHEKWLKNEPLFWTWMHSVLLERNRDNFPPNYKCIEEFASQLELKNVFKAT